MIQDRSIAFVIPCLNEAAGIAAVVKSCLVAAPTAQVYVFDNNSTDQTALVAAAAGARVIPSPKPGKGAVIRHAFSLLDADVILILDGDGTYPVELSPKLIDAIISEGAGMSVCCRNLSVTAGGFRPLHRLGNILFSTLMSRILRRPISDVFSGFRALSKSFYKPIQLEYSGFEVEAELTFKAALHGIRIVEVHGNYVARPMGDRSKLRTFRDGFLILKTIISLAFRQRRWVLRPSTAVPFPVPQPHRHVLNKL